MLGRKKDDDTDTSTVEEVAEVAAKVRRFNPVVFLVGLVVKAVRGLLALVIGAVGHLLRGVGGAVSGVTGSVGNGLVGTAKVVSPRSHRKATEDDAGDEAA